MSFESPPPPGRSYSPLTMTALLFFCIGVASAYAFFAIRETDFSMHAPDPPLPPLARQPVDNTTETTSPKVAPELPPATPAETEVLEAVDPPPAPSPADLTGHWPARHLVIGLPGPVLDAESAAMLAAFRPGGVLLRAENLVDAAQTRNLTLAIRTAVGLGTDIEALPIIFVEQEGGTVNPLKIDQAPAFAELGKANDTALVQKTARRYALTARARGISAMLAPTMDLYIDGVSEASLAERSFGANPESVSNNAIAFAQGLADGGVISIGRRYPGLGSAQLSQARVYEIPAADFSALALHLFPFAEAVALGIPGLVAGHASVPNLDTQNPARPASLSPLMIQTVLREKRGYEDVVLADDISTHTATSARPPGDVVVEALVAGCDAVIVSQATPEDVRRICETIIQAISDDALPAARLIQSRSRLERWQVQLSDWQPPDEDVLEDTMEEATPAQVDAPPAPVRPKPAPTPPDTPAKREPAPQPAGTERLGHKIEAGQTLAWIAGKYGVSIADLKAWNAIAGEDIQSGKTLTIYVPPAPATPVPENTAASPSPTPPARGENLEYVSYVVKPGDMLRRVAEAHGATEEEVVKLNALARPDIIQVGQTLKIPNRKPPAATAPAEN